MGFSEDMAAKLTPIALEWRESKRAEYRRTTPLPQRLFFPLIWNEEEGMIPGLVLTTIQGVLETLGLDPKTGQKRET